VAHLIVPRLARQGVVADQRGPLDGALSGGAMAVAAVVPVQDGAGFGLLLEGLSVGTSLPVVALARAGDQRRGADPCRHQENSHSLHLGRIGWRPMPSVTYFPGRWLPSWCWNLRREAAGGSGAARATLGGSSARDLL